MDGMVEDKCIGGMDEVKLRAQASEYCRRFAVHGRWCNCKNYDVTDPWADAHGYMLPSLRD